MRLAAMISAAALLVSGCGAERHAAVTTHPVTTAPAPPQLRIGVVGPLQLAVPGATVDRGSLAQVSTDPLVLVSAASADLATVAAAADAHATTNFALVGASTHDERRPNLVGLVLRDDQAALLGGVVAGFVAKEQSGHARVAWVGPQESRLAAAFARGVHQSLPGAAVLHAWSSRVPARCKEAALGAIARGAVVVMAHGGLCAAAAAAGAHQQNDVALSVEDFELPSVPAAIVARDALAGVFRGKEDLVFGAASGAIAVRSLDPGISAATALRARAAAQELASGLPPSG